MSDLDRILKLAGRAATAQSQPTMERELKPVQEASGCDCNGGGHCRCKGDCPDCNCHGNNDWDESVEEAVGEAAAPLYDLIDAHGAEAVLDELARYLDVDQIADFVSDYRRHHEMDSYDESIEEAKKPDEDGDYLELADWADTWASKNGIDYGDYDDYGINELADDFAEDDIDTKEKAIEYIKQMSYRKSIEEAKKPDEDGDGVPDWADKKPGEDDHEEKEEVSEATVCETCNEAECSCEEETLEEATVCETCNEAECSCEEETLEEMEVVSEAPTMDTTQLITVMKLAGLSEEAINKKLTEWANSAPEAAEQEPTSHGEPYENFAQSVNLSLKRYLDAENMKVAVSEHTVENMKALYESKKSKS